MSYAIPLIVLAFLIVAMAAAAVIGRWRRQIKLRWEQCGPEWHLLPVVAETRLVVKQDGPVWNIYVNDRPLMPGNYNNERGAKQSARQWAFQKGKFLFGGQRFKLCE